MVPLRPNSFMTPRKKSITLSLSDLSKSEVEGLLSRISKDPNWEHNSEPAPKVNPNRVSSPNYTSFRIATALDKARVNRVENAEF